MSGLYPTYDGDSRNIRPSSPPIPYFSESSNHPCFFQDLSRIRSLGFGNLSWRSFRHDLTASIATLRAEVNDPIRILDYIEIMFDHYHGVAGFDKPIQHIQQSLHVGKMEPGRRFIQNVHRASGRTFR